MKVVLGAVVLAVAAVGVLPAHAQTSMPMNQPPVMDCSDLSNQQKAIRLKLDRTPDGDEREQVKARLFEVEYHLRTDCFGK
jgi:hypothetical protein